MIKKRLCYELTCDRCGKKCSDGETTSFCDTTRMLAAAEMADWRHLKGRWYCPDCYEVDENDEYVPLGHMTLAPNSYNQETEWDLQ